MYCTPLKTNMSPTRGPFLKEISSSNHQFSGDMLVFREVFNDSFYLLVYIYIHEEKDGFYSIQFFEMWYQTLNLLESRNLQKRFRPLHDENHDLPAKHSCVTSLDLARTAKNDIMSC